MNNQIQLIGNIGNNPEITNFESGAKKVKFSLATNEKYRDKIGEYTTRTSWHNVYAWGSTAKYIISNAKKGAQLTVIGALKNRTYMAKDGNKRKITEIEIKKAIIS